MPQPSILQFGHPPENNDFIIRPGSYAVFFNEAGEAGIVQNGDGQYLLAGGGIEAGESREGALLREVLEETGLLVDIRQPLGTAQEYYLDEEQGRFYNKIGHFFLVEPSGKDMAGKVEDDHTLFWYPLEQALPLMYHDMYRWALNRAWAIQS